MSELLHKFDWYQATVPAMPEAMVKMLRDNLPEGHVRTDGKGSNSFKHLAMLHHPEGEMYCTVQHGGVNPHPNVTATGDHAPALATLLRDLVPDHRISRLDVAVDFRGDTAFDDSIRLLGRVSRKYRVKGFKLLAEDPDDGSTYYLGAKKSDIRLRCYEKGKELFAKTGDPVWRNLFDWVRMELQVRPKKDFKSRSATMEPEAFWGCSPWTRAIASGVFDMSPEPVSIKPTRIADHERAMRFLVAQYGPTIRRQVEKVGGWDAFTEDLKARLADHGSVAA